MFFDYRQNNSGGCWNYDEKDGIGIVVIVEADDAQAANNRAESLGLYFDGCNAGMDCPCCGDRWSEAWDGDGDTVPSIYGQPLENDIYRNLYGGWGHKYYGFIHYLDGTIKPIYVIKE